MTSIEFIDHLIWVLQLNIVLLVIGGFSLFFSIYKQDRISGWINGYSVIWFISTIAAYSFLPSEISIFINTSIFVAVIMFLLYCQLYKTNHCWIPVALHFYITVAMTLPLLNTIERIVDKM